MSSFCVRVTVVYGAVVSSAEGAPAAAFLLYSVACCVGATVSCVMTSGSAVGMGSSGCSILL